jgi:hypothetical protein
MIESNRFDINNIDNYKSMYSKINKMLHEIIWRKYE